ncbi:type II secretion system F family protein [Leifsonia sp. NPDC058230]|uniref:type II secretion system F family protein n=1 Tax=Leifsonia sp. NPDC058230 TaxID=3346391 RepID=UPI0036DA3B83
MRPGLESDEAAGVVERLAMLLDAGIAPESAWAYVAEFSPHPVAAAVSSAVGHGARPAEAFGSTGVLRGVGSEAWRALAAAWAVADASGAPLAPSLRQLATALRDRAETERDIDVGLTGPRSTARLVGWLPVAGVLLGMLMGVDIAGTLLGGVVGLGMLVVGVALLLGGRLWTRALTRRASPTSAVAGIDLDLIAVALTGGVSVERAKAVVREASAAFGMTVPQASGLERILGLAERAGAPAVDLLRSEAVQARRDARADGKRAAAALAVRLMLPLGVCVLPSFMLLGVAPVILSIVSSTIGSF